ncbi:MAG: Icc protein [Motiliproteus sp.]|jgi:Icc protein
MNPTDKDLLCDPDRPCKLIQLSDLHLPGLREQRYRDRDVEQQFLQILEHVHRQHPDLDALLLTGDLVQHGHADAYQRLAGYLNSFGKPWYWIAGNHDALAEMQRIRPTPGSALIANGWRILMLDSNAAADGLGSGSLGDAELARLEDQLQCALQTGESLLLVLHHNPLSVQSLWQDRIMLGDAERLWQLFSRYQVAVTVLFGHVHQVWDMTQQSVRLLSCPSTAVQFVRGQEQLLIETQGAEALPGYRWLTLSPAGSAQDKPSGLLSSGLLSSGLTTAIERVHTD